MRPVSLELPLTPCPGSFRTAALHQHLVSCNMQCRLPAPHAQSCLWMGSDSPERSCTSVPNGASGVGISSIQPLPQLNSLLLYLRYMSEDRDSYRKLCDLETCLTHSDQNVSSWWLELSLWEQSWVADEPFHLTWVQVICVGWWRDMCCLLPKSGPVVYFSQNQHQSMCGLQSSCHWNLLGCSFCCNYLEFLTPATIPFFGCAMLVYLTSVIVDIA